MMKLILKNGPLYIQVQNVLKERIINGKYPIDTLIPSETELKEEFGVSVITVRRAVEELVLQGYLDKRSGIGTTVLDNHAVSRLSKGQRFSEFLIDEGYDLRKRYLSLSIVDATEHTALAAFGDECYCVERLYTLNDQPYIHFKHYISKKVELPDDKSKLENSLYRMMYKQGFKFSHFKDEFGAAIAGDDVSEILQVEKNKALLQRTRYTYNIYDKLIEFSVAYYNSDMHKYVVNFTM